MLIEDIQEHTQRSVKLGLELGCQYVDVRGEVNKRNSISIENGQIENIGSLYDNGIGIRVLIEGVWGFCSVTSPKTFEEISNVLHKTIKNSKHYSQYTKNKIKLFEIKGDKSKINYPVLKKPSLDKLKEIGIQCDDIIAENEKIKKSTVFSWYFTSSKYFANSEGSEITQNYCDTVIEMSATAHDAGLTQSVNITEGGRGGVEQLTDDIVVKSAKEISEKASQLINAKPAKEEKTTVVLNPDFVALLTHEILGHPSEGDRVLGKEMAWAGGAWWKDKLGTKIGSDSLNVFDDPTIEKSLGWYQYDDEGIKTKRTSLIENGVLANHMQNRETANIFGTAPTGNMRATNYMFMPLIRMACTCIGEGDWNPEEMIKDVQDGYFISNMKIPSIDMNRYNWSISCQYAHKIENGEITDLLRDVIVLGTAPDFFNSIDACGKDFTVRPITNCGKGDPMQLMKMGNGGPTVRGIATVKSVN